MCCLNFFWSFLTGDQQQNVSSIDASLLKAVMDSSRLTMRKCYVDSNIADATVTAEKNLAFTSRTRTELWPEQGFFQASKV